MMPSVSMRTFREYDGENVKALLSWVSKNYRELPDDRFVLLNGGSDEISYKELIVRAAVEGIVARQWATLEISRVSLLDKNL
ncbi:MAG: hypothetical protein WBB28_07225 [Crinalium sp.]